MMRYRGLPSSPNASPARGGTNSPQPISTAGLFDPRSFRWIVFFSAVMITLCLPYLIATRILTLRSYEQVQSIELSKYCSMRYSNNTLDLGDASYFIALNLHNNDEVVPFLIPQIQRLVDALGPERVFVSIYESGSVDNTSRWILLYRQYLESHDIPHQIISDDRVRSRSQHRIDFLATVRNTVMAPLYQGKAKADYVIFINDVYFCAEDAVRLSQRVRLGKDVSMACGLDITADKRHDIVFYDSWVSRDMKGRCLDPSWPFFTRNSDIERLKQGLSIPVYACWNGLTAIDASVFSKIRFRSAPGDACLASECNFFCQDVWELAPGNLLLDPAVLLFYDKYVAERMLQYPVQGLGDTNVPVLTSFPEHEPSPSSYECLPLRGLDSLASPPRSMPEPANRQPYFWWTNQKLYLSADL